MEKEEIINLRKRINEHLDEILLRVGREEDRDLEYDIVNLFDNIAEWVRSEYLLHSQEKSRN